MGQTLTTSHPDTKPPTTIKCGPDNIGECMSTVLLITMQCLWHQWDVQYRYMRAQTGEQHGQRIQLKDGTYAHPQSIIGVM